MALFGLQKKKEEKKEDTQVKREKKPVAKTKVSTTKGVSPLASHVLLRPHVTEKAAQLTAAHVYAFEVSPRATKKTVADAVQALYKVSPVKVAIAKTPKKRVHLRTRRGWGTKGGVKKAYVYLKDGDRIEFTT